MTSPLVSIIVRTKNEERWIGSCLKAVFRQNYPNFEVILCDNQSTDATVKKASAYKVKHVEIGEYRPGRALNQGIRESKGEIIVCLSGHCIPIDEYWLSSLVATLDDPAVGGVYGRQEPMSFSSDFDKRDLAIVFGLDRKEQTKDPFFHNANSAFRRAVWNEISFDENVTNIEDRIWGQAIIDRGMKIVYEPGARVFHHHGIHQDLDRTRARQVVQIMEGIHGAARARDQRDLADMSVLAIVPVRGPVKYCGDRPLLEYTLRAALNARFVTDVVVAADNPEHMEIAKRAGARAPFQRPERLSDDYVNVTDVLRYSLERVEEKGSVPDLVIVLEETYPFRTVGMIDDMLLELARSGVDSVIATKTEYRHIWLQNEGQPMPIGDGFMPRQLKSTRAHIGLIGLGCVTHPMYLRDGRYLGDNVGIYEVVDPFASIEIRDEKSLNLSTNLIEDWWRQQERSA